MSVIMSLTCLFIGMILLVLGNIIHEIFGIFSSFFFILFIVLYFISQKNRIKRSTLYTLESIILALWGLGFLILARYIHPIFGTGDLIFYYAALAIGLFSVAIIISSGEILNKTGVLKIILLIVVGCLIARVTVLELNQARSQSQGTSVEKNQEKAEDTHSIIK